MVKKKKAMLYLLYLEQPSHQCKKVPTWYLSALKLRTKCRQSNAEVWGSQLAH